MTTHQTEPDSLREQVRARYAAAAVKVTGGQGGCGNPPPWPSCERARPSLISAQAAVSTCSCRPSGSARPARRTGST